MNISIGLLVDESMGVSVDGLIDWLVEFTRYCIGLLSDFISALITRPSDRKHNMEGVKSERELDIFFEFTLILNLTTLAVRRTGGAGRARTREEGERRGEGGG